MTKSSKAKLEYQSEYQKRPEEVAKRVARNAARREAIREGRAHVGDGKDVGHKVALSNGGSASKSNTRIESRESNRGWRAGNSGKDSYKVRDKK